MVISREQINAVCGLRALVKRRLPVASELLKDAHLNAEYHGRCCDEEFITESTRAAHRVFVAGKAEDTLDGIFIRFHRGANIVGVSEFAATTHIFIANALTKGLISESWAAKITMQDNIVQQAVAQVLCVSRDRSHKIFNATKQVSKRFEQGHGAARAIRRSVVYHKREGGVGIVTIGRKRRGPRRAGRNGQLMAYWRRHVEG